MRLFRKGTRPVAFPAARSAEERVALADARAETIKSALGIDSLEFWRFAPANLTNVLYRGVKSGRPCLVKYSEHNPRSLVGEYELVARLHEACPDHFTMPMGCDTVGTGVAFAVEWIDGPTLFDVKDESSFPALVTQLTDLTLLFDRLGFVHCDFHPGNVLVAKDSRVVLIDFQMSFFLNERTGCGWDRIRHASSVYRTRCPFCEIGVANDRRSLLRATAARPDLYDAFSRAWQKDLGSFDRKIPIGLKKRLYLLASLPRVLMSLTTSKPGSGKRTRAQEKMALLKHFFFGSSRHGLSR